MPLEDSNPTIGKRNEIIASAEYKVEMLCDEKSIKAVIKKLIAIHPYEEPAYEIHHLLTLEDL